jgi:UPF0755 protein
MKKVNIFIILIILVIVGGFFFYKEGLMPVSVTDKSVKFFVINKGESVDEIVKSLDKENLIRSKTIFYLILKQTGIDKNVQAGEFRLSPSMTAMEIAQNLTKGTMDTQITIIEGLRKEEIAQIFSKELDIPVIEFVKTAKEGYLFPDTYFFQKNADVSTVLEILQNNFDSKFTPELKANMTAKKLTLNQVITIASLVEKEARLDPDRKIVASIIYKRYKEDWNLQIDATVQYAIGYQTREKTWWKRDLSMEDLSIDSPYNTYKRTGLPPGPICNPGISSIIAAINADASTPYWYYISDKTGKMHYAKTLDEHDANIAKYLN